MKWMKNFYNWIGQKVRTPYADYWFAGAFFVEAFFFLPVDPLLMLFCLKNRKKSFFYAGIATVASVVGGAWGYLLGAVLWQSIGQMVVSLIISEKTFLHAIEIYKSYQNWAVLVAGFTPLPFKALTLSAGFCKLPFLPFITCSLIARGARFFLVAACIKMWGDKVEKFIGRYLNYILLGLVALLVLGALWYFRG